MAQSKERTVQLASDYVPPSGGDQVWIRRFNAPTTQIRICPATGVNARGEKVYGTEAWPTAREHYEAAAGAWACEESLGGTQADCDGCKDESERVQRRQRMYYINAVDENGEYRVYKLGANLYKTFKAREQRLRSQRPENLQPLSDRDYLINRMGTGLDTTYDPESGDKYEFDFDESKYHDIKAVLVERAAEAHAIYTGEEAPLAAKPKADQNGDHDDEDDKPARPARKRASMPDSPTKAAEPDEDTVVFKDHDDIDEATTSEIKSWLKARKADFVEGAPRARLVKTAKEFFDQNPPY
jgi:hypothetical protein